MSQIPQQRLLVVVMGVSGSGKTTVASELARDAGFVFVEGDELHPRENIERMQSGLALDDRHRMPWLRAIEDRCRELTAAGDSVVLACSALKPHYRQQLRKVDADIIFLHLVGSAALITERMSDRADHFMPTSLIASQFAALEISKQEDDIVDLSIDQSSSEVIRQAKDIVTGRC